MSSPRNRPLAHLVQNIITTPCAPLNITWTDGTPPFNVTISADNFKVVQKSNVTDHSVLWLVNAYFTNGDDTVLKVDVEDQASSHSSTWITVKSFPPPVGIGCLLPPTGLPRTPNNLAAAGNASSSPQGMSPGATAGLAIGVAVGSFVLAVALTLIVVRRQKRARGGNDVPSDFSLQPLAVPSSRASMGDAERTAALGGKFVRL
ncbi:uncharacterized protein BXZ73DRAFT_76959 [Epithele typhae]|uniref:uncharacterized protein n=1 Tax=Epithele typhae TaxID=378194 RepID=UPI002007948A|nr:uncharacterized protein BXZ73DRAFT_76959 [Epithele typhae]KAH9934471.1 hypothetical protein BXZ73DRAFT_76959 [Epithele typhae]